jgi:hypothetical protein
MKTLNEKELNDKHKIKMKRKTKKKGLLRSTCGTL